LNVAIDHLLLGGTLAAKLVHDDEPMLIVAAEEERGHLGGGPAAEVGPRVEGRVGRDAEHLLLGGFLAVRLVHDNELVLIVGAEEQRGHLSGWRVAEVGPRVEGQVG
jgi:hypothetical protein